MAWILPQYFDRSAGKSGSPAADATVALSEVDDRGTEFYRINFLESGHSQSTSPLAHERSRFAICVQTGEISVIISEFLCNLLFAL